MSRRGARLGGRSLTPMILWLLLHLLNGGAFSSSSPITLCTRLLDELAGCPMSPGLGAMRTNPCENLTSWICSLGSSPRFVP